MMHLYMIRHGQSHVNLAEWDSGNTDEGLTELGQKQAAALAQWLPKQVPEIDVLYTSTMRRALETAEHLAQAYDMKPRYEDSLREIGNNRWDHSAWPNDALPREYADYWASERPFSTVTPFTEGGETFIHFRTRVGIFLEGLVERRREEQQREETVVVVCHGGVIEATFDHIFNVGPWRRCEIWNHNTGVTYFEYVEHPRRETWRLHYNNRTCHLLELA